MTVIKIHLGLEVVATGKKKLVLSEEFDRLLSKSDHRMAAFDEEAGPQAANLAAARQTKERVVDLRDTMIAGIVWAHHASIATRYVARFSDISPAVVNPWPAWSHASSCYPDNNGGAVGRILSAIPEKIQKSSVTRS